MKVLMNISWNHAIMVFLMAIICTNFAHAYYTNTDLLVADVMMKNSFTVDFGSDSSSIGLINVTMDAFPRDDIRQKVSSLETTPESSLIDDQLFFSWKNPVATDYDISVKSQVINTYMPAMIDKKVSFPLTDLDHSLFEYIQPTEVIDVTPEIQELASGLSVGQTDLYSVEYKFAEYVHNNIEYDLSTLTADVNQKSSWVLENKIGVCDELTNLFISLNRAVGIPARFVSGIAYTDLNIFDKSWVSHAWAEVYFPGYGWVPFDITYAQYGYVDVSHIKLSVNTDGKMPSMKYNYVGRDITVKPGEILQDVNVVQEGKKIQSPYDITVSLFSSEAGFGSYDIVQVELDNLINYYVVADIYLADTEGMTIIGKDANNRNRQQVLLKPKSSNKAYWIIKVDDTLRHNYYYTFPITVYNSFNYSSSTSLQSREDFRVMSLDAVSAIVDEGKNNKYNDLISFTCKPDKNSIYLDEDTNITCYLENFADANFANVEACMLNECKEFDLGIEKKTLEFHPKFVDVGVRTIPISVKHVDFTKAGFVTIDVKDKPVIDILNITFPDAVNFNDYYEIKFTIGKTSHNTPLDVTVSVFGPTAKHSWMLPELADDRVFSVESDGRSMKPNDNKYLIKITYHDDKNNEYVVEKNIVIKSNASFFQDIILWFNGVAYWFENL